MPNMMISINLQNKKCVVIGGGKIAQNKIETLLSFNAQIVVSAPYLTEKLQELVNFNKIEYIKSDYQPELLNGAFLAIAATNDNILNKNIFRDAADIGVLVNVVDQPDLCSFFFPAIFQRGNLVIGISTSGDSPALSRCLKERFKEELGEEYSYLLELLKQLRPLIANNYPDMEDRYFAVKRIIESDAIDLLASGKETEAKELAIKCI